MHEQVVNSKTATVYASPPRPTPVFPFSSSLRRTTLPPPYYLCKLDANLAFIATTAHSPRLTNPINSSCALQPSRSTTDFSPLNLCSPFPSLRDFSSTRRSPVIDKGPRYFPKEARSSDCVLSSFHRATVASSIFHRGSAPIGKTQPQSSDFPQIPSPNGLATLIGFLGYVTLIGYEENNPCVETLSSNLSLLLFLLLLLFVFFLPSYLFFLYARRRRKRRKRRRKRRRKVVVERR